MINQYKSFGRTHCLHFRGTTVESVIISNVIAKIVGVLVPICVIGTTLFQILKRCEGVFQANAPGFPIEHPFPCRVPG